MVEDHLAAGLGPVELDAGVVAAGFRDYFAGVDESGREEGVTGEPEVALAVNVAVGFC